MESPVSPARASVELRLDEDSGVLAARVYLCEEEDGGAANGPLTLESLQFEVDASGYGDFSFESGALTTLLRRLQRCEEGEFIIATRRDADVAVAATADRLQALLTTTRAYGGRAVTAERIREAAAEAGISPDLMVEEVIAQAAAGPPVSNAVLARGVAPQSGVDSRIEILVDLASETSKPREREDGGVDHYSVREFLIVDEGTELLRRFPPTRGVAGLDVLGKPITARDGKDHPLPRDMPGVRPHEDDPELMVADFKGHPVAIPGGIRVDKTLVMEHVDLRTGNVDFDGSVLVKGDVAAGVTIKATGDVTVKGTVENAFVHAGANLLVARGFTGSNSAMQGGERDVWGEADVDFEAGFACGVIIRAGGDVKVKEYLNHCDTFAAGQVLVGQNGGHGLVVGGLCHGCLGVTARAIGTTANVPTSVSVGPRDALHEKREAALEERRSLVARLDQLKAMLATMTETEDESGQERDKLAEKVRRTIDEFERRTAEMDGRLQEIGAEFADAEQAVVICNQRIFAGVTIEVGGESMLVRSEGNGGRFSCQRGEVVWQ